MATYTFTITASVSVEADSEDEALRAVIRSCQEQDEDVPYGEMSVYIPSYGDVELADVYDHAEV